MGVITVPGQGRNYSIKIAGDTPTPEEQERINAFISQQGQPAPAADEGFLSGVGTAFGVGVDQLQQGYGSALEGVGSVLGIEGLQNYGRETAAANEKEAAEGAQRLTGREDVTGLGSAAAYFGETLAQNAPQLLTSLGGGFAGAAAGTALAGPPGAVIGGILGGTGVNLPFFYGQNRERQKEAIDKGLKVEVDEGAAALAAVPQAALDAIVDRFMVGKFLSPEALRAGGLFTRAVKSGAAGVVTEVPTEVGQQVIERMQAGLPLWDDEAIKEYTDAAIAAGLVGGTVGGISGGASGDIRKKREKERADLGAKELDEDLQELVVQADQRLKYGLTALNTPPSGEARTEAVAPTLALPPPDPSKAPVAPSPEAQRPSRTYGQGALDAAVAKVRELGRYSAPAIQNAIAKTTGQKPSISTVREIARDLEQSGILIPDAKQTGGYRVGKVPENNFSLSASLRQTLNDLDRTIAEDRMAREKALIETRRLQQMGGTRKQVREAATLSDALAAKIAKAEQTKAEVAKRLETADKAVQVPTKEQPRSPITGTSMVTPITKATPEAQKQAVDARVANLQTALAQREERIKKANAQIKTLQAEQKKGPLPTEFARQLADLRSTVAEDKIAISDLKDRIKDPAPAIAQEQREIEAKVVRQQAAQAARTARTPIYTGQQQKVFNALRKRLNNLGLGDVRLVAERVIRPDLAQRGNLVEGSFDVKDGNRVIALAMSTYDPKLSDQQLFDAISEVMNHEVIHALLNLGLFTDAEWKVLTDLARRQKFMKRGKDGNGVERNYTYLDRAKRMYGSSTPEIQIEEAIAEMFRDYVAGRLKVGGKPRSLMERIKGFFRGLWKAHEDAGLTDVNAIFEGIRFGKIGQRERSMAKPQEASRTSDVKKMLGGARERIAKRNEMADRIAEQGRPVMMSNGAQRALVGPNTIAGQKPFRVTYMGDDGKPNGHVEAASLRDAAIRAMEDGFMPEDKQRTSEPPKWVERFSSVNSPEFQRWFSEAQTKAPDGGPLRVYHATRFADEIETFMPMTHFGTVKAANDRINFTREWRDDPSNEKVYPLYIALKNPLDVDREQGFSGGGGWYDDFDTILQVERALRTKSIQEDATGFESDAALLLREIVANAEGREHYEQVKRKARETAAQVLLDLGYDGITYTNIIEDPGSTSYIILKPQSVKSVFNTGKFDPENPDTRLSKIDTPAFKRWFGDSKVVNEDGTPKVVYHGTKKPFYTFDRSVQGTTSFIGIPVKVDRQGFYFAEKRGFADGFARQDGRDAGVIMPVYLSIENPLDVTQSDNATVDRLREVVKRAQEIRPEINNPDFFLRAGYDNFWELLDNENDGDAFVQAMRDLGYDGIKMIEPDWATADPDYVPDDTGAVTWVAFEPSQIKSVNNAGTFNPDDPDIRFSSIDTEAFRNWFKESAVVDDEGNPLPVYHGTTKAGFFVFDTEPDNWKTKGTGAFFTDDIRNARTYSGTNEKVKIWNRDEVLANPGAFGFDVREWFGKVSVTDPDGYEEEVPGVASQFDDEAIRPTLEKMVDDWLTSDRFTDEHRANYEVYLSIQNPFVYDAQGRAWNELGEEDVFIIKDEDDNFVDIFYDDWTAESELEVLQEENPKKTYRIEKEVRPGEQSTDDIVRDVREMNEGSDNPYDGVIFENIQDSGSEAYGSYEGKVFVVFKPEQIKAVDNYGTFDPKNKDIRYSALPAFEDTASPQERAQMEQVQDIALRYSKSPKIKPVLAPVKTKEGKDTYIYGTFMDRGRKKHVMLPEGDHKDIGSGSGVGFGRAHIKARMHDEEIKKYTAYPDETHAIFDMLKKWDEQGGKDGKAIRSVETADGYELTWSDGFRTKKSPPLRLALWRHGDLPILYVKTFFPELPVELRLWKPKSSMEQKGANRGQNQTGRNPYRESAVPTGAAGDRAGRHQGGSLAPLEGAPTVAGASGPDPRLTKVAEDYARSIGISLKRQAEYVKVDPERARRIAAAYDAMRHAPDDPVVQEAYQNLIEQTKAQYRALVEAGYEFSFFDDNTDPYGGNPWNAMRDLRKNKKMAVYGTYVGFGTEGITAVDQETLASPMLADTGLRWKDQTGTERPVFANDLFRAVHDAFGHGLEGAGFRADGEENAWQAHVRLFTGSAVGAITSETRGQNSWLNFGPYGEQNRTAKVEDTVFAEQKIGLMPEWTWTEGRAGDMGSRGDLRTSMLSVKPTLSAETKQNMGKAEVGMMYARSADLIASILNLKGKGVRMDKARRIADGILRRFQDNMLPVGRMVQELSAAGLKITDAMDPYLQEELMHGKVGAKIAENQKNLFTPVVEAIKKIKVEGLDLEALKRASNDAAKDGKGFAAYMLNDTDSPRTALADIYLYARHAKERNKFIKEVRDPENAAGSGMTDREADAILTWFNRMPRESLNALAEMEVGIKAVVADTNKVRLDAGLISKETVEKNPFKNYVPLRGVYDPDGDMADAIEQYAGPPGRPRLGARGKEDPMIKGRFDYASDLVANIFTQNQNAVLRGERNKVGQSFLKLLRADKDKTEGYAKILDRRPMTRAVNAQGKNVEVVDFQAIRSPDMLVVKEDGRETFVRFDDVRLAGALNGQNGMAPANANALISAMSKVNRYLASINTSYNPEFMITNMFRDLQTAGVNVNQFEKDGITKDVLGGLKGALMGIRRSIRKEDDTSEWSQIYKDFVAAGGQNATNQFNSLSEEMAGIKKMLGDVADGGLHGKWNKVKHGIVGKSAGSLLRLVEDYNTVIENGIRVATYKALLDRGFTRERAAQAARNVTVNFAKGGDYRQFMNAFYLFYNASLQGSFALLNAAVRSPRVRRIWASVIAVGILQDQLNAALSDDDDDGQKVYDKIPSYVLEHNLILPDPFGLTDRSYISIPMPYGLNMAVNAGRAMSRAARGAYDPSEAATTIFGTALDTLNPIGGAESFANFAAPTIVDPFIDIVENEDFANKPIYKENLVFDRTPAPDSQMFWSTTSPSSIWVAKNLNELTGGNAVRSGFADFSPDVMEFWFDFLTGGVGRFVQRAAELPVNVYEDGLGDDLIRNIPFARKAIGSVSQTEDMGSYIEKASTVLMAGEELKQAKETGDAAWAKETMDRYGAELRVLPRVKAFETALRKISRQMNEIEKNPRLAESQKRAMMDKLKERKQVILSAANKLLADF